MARKPIADEQAEPVDAPADDAASATEAADLAAASEAEADKGWDEDPEDGQVRMVKDGVLHHVAESAVAAHEAVGWEVVHPDMDPTADPPPGFVKMVKNGKYRHVGVSMSAHHAAVSAMEAAHTAARNAAVAEHKADGWEVVHEQRMSHGTAPAADPNAINPSTPGVTAPAVEASEPVPVAPMVAEPTFRE